MRVRELSESYQQSLDTDLDNILVSAKGAGADNVSTQALCQQLMGMGYSVSPDSLSSLLMNNPIVMSATPETVTFAQGGENPTDTEDSADRVADMAQKATDKKIGR